MALLDSQELTAAAALSPPQPGMTLVKVRLIGGATPGTFELSLDGQASAHFPAPANGIADYDINHPIAGTNIPAGSVALNGGVARVILTYSTAGGQGPGLNAFRAIRFARTDGGAVTADISVDYDVGPARPKGIVPYISASNGRFEFPSTGALTYIAECSPEEDRGPVLPVPDLPETNSLVLEAETDAAATIQGVVLY